MDEMVSVIHIPEYEHFCKDILLAQIKHILDVCSKSLDLNYEHWLFNFDDITSNVAAYIHNAKTGECWENGMKLLKQKELALITGIIYYTESGSTGRNSIGGSAVLSSHTQYQKLPRDNGERSLIIRIPLCLWKLMNQYSYVQAVKEASVSLKATYACIDEFAPIGGIYEGWFREFAYGRETIGIESMLPGIYWCQLVSEKMVEQTGPLKEILKTIPCECAEILDCNDSKVLWIEIAKDYRKATRKKRLTIRNYFEHSLYQLSLDKAYHSHITNWASLPSAPPFVAKHMLRCMKHIPLTDAEIETIMKYKP